MSVESVVDERELIKVDKTAKDIWAEALWCEGIGIQRKACEPSKVLEHRRQQIELVVGEIEALQSAAEECQFRRQLTETVVGQLQTFQPSAPAYIIE